MQGGRSCKAYTHEQRKMNKVHKEQVKDFFQLKYSNQVVQLDFKIDNRTYLKNIISHLNSKKLWFAYQLIDLKSPFNPAQICAVFPYPFLLSAISQVKSYIGGIQLKYFQVLELYQMMSSRSFVDINFFERMGKVDYKVLKESRNPFMKVYLAQNVYDFPNIDNASLFLQTISSMSIDDLFPKKEIMSQQQINFSNIFFTTKSSQTFYLTETDKQTLIELRESIRVYEVSNGDFDMIDESDEFENVNYTRLDLTGDIPPLYLEMMRSLVERRLSYIQDIRSRLKEERRRER